MEPSVPREMFISNVKMDDIRSLEGTFCQPIAHYVGACTPWQERQQIQQDQGRVDAGVPALCRGSAWLMLIRIYFSRICGKYRTGSTCPGTTGDGASRRPSLPIATSILRFLSRMRETRQTLHLAGNSRQIQSAGHRAKLQLLVL